MEYFMDILWIISSFTSYILCRVSYLLCFSQNFSCSVWNNDLFFTNCSFHYTPAISLLILFNLFYQVKKSPFSFCFHIESILYYEGKFLVDMGCFHLCWDSALSYLSLLFCATNSFISYCYAECHSRRSIGSIWNSVNGAHNI